MDNLSFMEVDRDIKNKWLKYSNWSRQINEEVIWIKDGFSILAKYNNDYAGIISVNLKKLKEPLNETIEAYIDNVEVRGKYRKQGIATALLNEAIDKLKENENIYQVRAWSSNDKVAMLNLWRKVGFSLCPVIQHFGDNKVNGFFVVKKL